MNSDLGEMPNVGVDAGERQHAPSKSIKLVEKHAIEPRVQRIVMLRFRARTDCEQKSVSGAINEVGAPENRIKWLQAKS